MPGQKEGQKEGRTEGQILLYRTLWVTAKGPEILFVKVKVRL